MGLFNFFKNKKANFNGNGSAQNGHDIPEDVFIEKGKPSNSKNGNGSVVLNIDHLYQFLNGNYESQGYDDALANPDASYMEQNVEGLKNELDRKLRMVRSYYVDFIKAIDFHLVSRSKSGMVDIVEELKMKKEVAENHIGILSKIEEDALNNQGDSQGIFLSYTRGFRRGLAAISYHEVLKKEL